MLTRLIIILMIDLFRRFFLKPYSLIPFVRLGFSVCMCVYVSMHVCVYVFMHVCVHVSVFSPGFSYLVVPPTLLNK